MSLYCFLTILLWTGRLGIGMNGRIRIGIGGRFTQEYAVRQTYLIYRLLQSKSLMLPKVFGRNELEFPENYYQMPTSKSTACNFCKNDELYTIENLKYSENLENEKAYKLIVCMNCLTIRRDNNK